MIELALLAVGGAFALVGVLAYFAFPDEEEKEKT